MGMTQNSDIRNELTFGAQIKFTIGSGGVRQGTIYTTYAHVPFFVTVRLPAGNIMDINRDKITHVKIPGTEIWAEIN